MAEQAGAEQAGAEQAGLLAGKRGVVMGVANDKSIAWGIAKNAAEQGAEICLTYQGAGMAKRVKPLAQKLGSEFVLPCDVADDESIDEAFRQIEAEWGTIDFLVHAIAYSQKDELEGAYVDTTRQNFRDTLDISAYSLTAVCQRARRLMPNGGSVLTLTYYGAEQVIPHYNVMGVAKAALEASVRYLAVDLGDRGIRVNAISAGPIRTLAASGIGDFRYIMKWNELNAPLHRNVTIDDVGRSGAYLLSDFASGVTGEVHHVDAGYHAVGMCATDRAGELSDLLEKIKKAQE